MLTLSKQMWSADNNPKFSNFFLKKFQIQIVIIIFGFTMKNALKWVQTSLVSVQWFLR